jgi:hypothetical protein
VQPIGHCLRQLSGGVGCVTAMVMHRDFPAALHLPAVILKAAQPGRKVCASLGDSRHVGFAVEVTAGQNLPEFPDA